MRKHKAIDVRVFLSVSNFSADIPLTLVFLSLHRSGSEGAFHGGSFCLTSEFLFCDLWSFPALWGEMLSASLIIYFTYHFWMSRWGAR